ncbi:hypothetical protein GOP47_0029314 [Adiantum capillus-veneris]|nr:hypothetical protein GOP47_0029314 [Adiantum capillus-veneris]
MSAKQQPHALIFPFPAQGHINPMMQLAMRLLDEGFFITFVNTDHNHERMFPKPTADNARLRSWFGTYILNSNESPPLTCILADACCTWIQDVADQFHIPRVSLWTTPVHANIAYTFQSTLQSLGIIPVKDQSKLQEVVHYIQGIAPMKLEDYISFFFVDSTTDFMFQWFLRLSLKRPLEAAWNLGNDFEELESEACAAFKKEVPDFLPTGPLLLIDVRHGNPHDMESTSIGSMWPEDTTCKDWLSKHEKASVIYIAFGSVVNMLEEEIGELIQGLEESGAPFLWAVRPDLRGAALSRLREKLDSEAVQGKPSGQGMLVSWAPQLAVLTHPSVGLFVSHCGWNSVIESVAGGVPILEKTPGFAEQSMNAHYITDVWKIGHRLPNGASASDIKLLIS